MKKRKNSLKLVFLATNLHLIWLPRPELLRAQNDVVKIFTKFLSEPMKILTNIYGNSKHLKIIAMFEKHKVEIEEHFNDKLVAEQKGLDDYKNAIVRDEWNILKQKNLTLFQKKNSKNLKENYKQEKTPCQ